MTSDKKPVCTECKTENPINSKFCNSCGFSFIDDTGEIEFKLKPQKTIANRFRIINELGKGAMGLVYKAWDQKLDRYITLKTIKFEHKKTC